MFAVIGVFCLLQATLAPAQLITFRDGKVGVNFAGYHADAGLGGLLTGNSAHGGLSASAGTPWGSRAAAGIGGDLNGRTAGVAYAGAQANPDVGASAVLSGSVGERGYAGAEAHSNGKVSGKHYSVQQQGTDAPPAIAIPEEQQHEEPSHVQKIKPPKKYSLIRPEVVSRSNAKAVHAKSVQKPVYQSFAPQSEANPVWLGLQIPIGILQSLQNSIGGLPAPQPPASYRG
ncbi:uncharacterized protein LOC115629827 [Scaptodrosophila lebanonensis]|uniref:Uncharacterized protein LOC115629827 n=1 Tax=Drosophila lebanonensis TaxID=7225 RepID=A0A6J2U0P9_DROLE|nr:uncharacterized protein LOC115629827 [Scaptodrosophila lebanonensis]